MNKELTPKEKAQELVDRFLNQGINFPYIDSEDGQCIGAGYMTYNSAKQCALIAVDEILNEYPSQAPKNSYEMERHIYFQEVKTELEKL